MNGGKQGVLLYIIGITGGSGSGKTTFAQKIANEVPSGHMSILHLDSYYLDTIPDHLKENDRVNFDHPEAFDWKLLKSHLISLQKNLPITMPSYCFKSCKRLNESIELAPPKILLIEGILTLYHSYIRDFFDLKIFLNVEADIRFSRRLHRDIEDRGRSLQSVIDQYYSTVRPMHNDYLEPQRQYADLTVGEETDRAASVISAMIRERISQLNFDPSSLNNNIHYNPQNVTFSTNQIYKEN